MNNANAIFLANMRDADNLNIIHDFLSKMEVPMSFDDILRSKIVYSVSAFDKFIHDLVRIGMVHIYAGKRAPTPKYLAEPISLSIAQQLATTLTPPPEVVFEQAILAKLKNLSFQYPDKVADGLSYIWDEKHKWQRIANGIGLDESVTRTTLRLIAGRRNAIVHEADIDPVTGLKQTITRNDTDDVITFLLNVGNEIFRLVT